MGWADDMYEKGYTSEHGGTMDEKPSRTKRSNYTEYSKGGPGSKWTEAGRERMIEMYESDLSIRIIAKELNRTPYAVAYQLFNMNKISENIKDKFKNINTFDTSVRCINSTEGERTVILDLFDDDTSIKKIAIQVNRSPHSVAIELLNNKKINIKETAKFKKNGTYDTTRSDFEEREKVRKTKTSENNKKKAELSKSKLQKANIEDAVKIILFIALMIIVIVIV
jgi:hypothetical protein